jgi:hypothetical protein
VWWGIFTGDEMTTKLRLFMLRHRKRGPAVHDDKGNVLYFSNKPEAKKHRDSMLTESPTVVVSYGPDHNKFIGE